MIERSEVKRSVASFLDVSNSSGFGSLLKDVEKCRVVSSSYQWIGHSVMERSLMNNR